MQKVDKEITYFTDNEEIINHFKRIKKRLKKEHKANVFLFEDEEEGYPERKFITAEVQKPFPDGLVFISYSDDIKEIMRNLDDYLNF